MRASLDCALASFLPMSVKSNSFCFDIMHACRQACTHTGGNGLCFLIKKKKKKIGCTKSSKAWRSHKRNNQKPAAAAAAKTTTPFFFVFNGAPASSSSYASLLEDNKRTHHGRCLQISSSCGQTQNISTTPPKDFHFLSFSFFALSLCQKQPPKRSCGVMGICEKQNSQEQQVYKGFSDCHGSLKHHHKNLAESDDATTTDSARDFARAKEERTQREREKKNMVGR